MEQRALHRGLSGSGRTLSGPGTIPQYFLLCTLFLVCTATLFYTEPCNSVLKAGQAAVAARQHYIQQATREALESTTERARRLFQSLQRMDLSIVLGSKAEDAFAHSSVSKLQHVESHVESTSSVPVHTSAPITTPLWWFAPFLEEGGFGEQAATYLRALTTSHLAREDNIWLSPLQAKCEGPRDTLSNAGLHTQLFRGSHAHTQHKSKASDSASHVRGGHVGAGQALRAAPLDAVVVCHHMPMLVGRPHSRLASCSTPCPPPDRPAAYAITFAAAETDTFTPSYVAPLNSLQEVWVPSTFSQHVLSKAGVAADKIQVMPPVVDVDFYNPHTHTPLDLPLGVQVSGPGAAAAAAAASTKQQQAARRPRQTSQQQQQQVQGQGQQEGQEARRSMKQQGEEPGSGAGSGELSPPFTFISTFPWGDMQGWDVTLEAYLSEFGGSEGVQLLLVSEPSMPLERNAPEGGGATLDPAALNTRGKAGKGKAQQPATAAADICRWIQTRLHRNCSDMATVYVVPPHMPAQQYARLLRAVHAFVLPTRGEAWGTSILQAMSMGLPVIATNWSVVPSILDDSVGYPLSYSLTQVPSSDLRWPPYTHRAEPDIADLCRLMRRLVTHRAEAKLKGMAARQRVVETHSPGAVAAQLACRLNDISSKRARAAAKHA